MKRALLFIAALVVLTPAMMALKKTPPPPPPPAAAAEEIHWITSMDELQAKMQKEPKKVYIDMYTDWCGWCKKMDVATFTNPALVKYMNRNYYAVKFDAERKDAFVFQGKEYHYEPQYKAHTFAVELMKGQMGYPTGIIMQENFQNPNPVSGYMTVPQIEVILTYFGDNAYKHIQWPEYQKTYTSKWDNGAAPVNNASVPGH